MIKVFIIESEAGWGQKVDSTLEFSTKEEAEAYCREYNNKHNPIMDKTPDWYMYAKMRDKNTEFDSPEECQRYEDKQTRLQYGKTQCLD